MTERPVLLVIADSLAHHGPERAHPADDARIWPVLAAGALGWRCELVARIGWTSRDAWWVMTQDPRVWAAIPHTGAVVLAVGGMDTLPSPLPTALREELRYLRPPALRRAAQRLSAVPAGASAAGLAGGFAAAAVGALPGALPGRAARPAAGTCRPRHAALGAPQPQLRRRAFWATGSRARVAGVVGAHRGADGGPEGAGWRARPGWAGNPDGLHWGWQAHRAVADAVVAQVRREADPAASATRER